MFHYFVDLSHRRNEGKIKWKKSGIKNTHKINVCNHLHLYSYIKIYKQCTHVFVCELHWPKLSAYQTARKHKHTTRNACILNLKNLWQITNCIRSCNLLERRLFTFAPLSLYSFTHSHPYSPNLRLPAISALEAALCISCGKKGEAMHSIAISSIYVESTSQRRYFGTILLSVAVDFFVALFLQLAVIFAK